MVIKAKAGNRLVEFASVYIDKYEDKDRQTTVYTVNALDTAGLPNLLGRYDSFNECLAVVDKIHKAVADGALAVSL